MIFVLITKKPSKKCLHLNVIAKGRYQKYNSVQTIYFGNILSFFIYQSNSGHFFELFSTKKKYIYIYTLKSLDKAIYTLGN